MGITHSSTPRRSIAVAVTLGVAASLTAAMSSPAGAEEDPTRERNAPGIAVREAPSDSGAFVVSGGAAQESAGLSQAALNDLRTYARTSGEDYDALVASHQGVDEFAAYVDRLEARRPGLFTAAGIADGGGDNWIQVTGRPGAAEVSRMESLPVDVRVEYGAPASSAELARLSEQLIDSVGERPGLVASAQAAYDDETRQMVLSFKPADGAPAARVERGVDTLLRSAVPRTEVLPLPVVTREVAVDTRAEVNVTGGRNLKSGGQLSCTAGFTVTRQGRRGLLTARHCPNRLTYGQRANVLAKVPAQTAKRKFDLQFHRVQRSRGHVTGSRFQDSRSGTRAVRRVSNAPRGSVVCHWGAVSRFSCAKVRFTNQCVILSGQKTCALDGTNRYISAPGDSGGPWFLGNTARGIHAGGGPGGSGQRGISLFTRISKTSALGARVLRK